MLGIVHWVLLVAPLGVLALAFVVGTRTGAGGAGLLAHYVVLVVATCLLITALAYVVVGVAGKLSPSAFARAALPAQIVAMSTQSSLASLPTMIDAAGVLHVRGGMRGSSFRSPYRCSARPARRPTSLSRYTLRICTACIRASDRS